jgi:hypothetical protein
VVCKASVHHRHKQFRQGGRDRYAAVIFWKFRAALAFKKWCDLRCSPQGGCQLIDGAVIK